MGEPPEALPCPTCDFALIPSVVNGTHWWYHLGLYSQANISRHCHPVGSGWCVEPCHVMLAQPSIPALSSCRWWLALGCSCSAWERLRGRLAIGWDSHKRSAFACSCFAHLPCVLNSTQLICSSDASPLLLRRLKPLTGNNRRRIGHTSWGNGGAACSRTARSVASGLERHLRPVAAAAQVHAAWWSATCRSLCFL